MRYILKGRGLGKTTDLIYLSAQTGVPIVCMQTDLILYQANRLNITIPKPISHRRFMTMNPKPDKVFVDDLNVFLRSILGCTVDTVTDTPEQITGAFSMVFDG